MENWQDEIIKAQISQKIGVERSMENSDISVFLKSFKENLIGAVDRDSFDKSWSSDLQSKFPNGSWKTVNGARVFVNNGKVVAGLDGFNGEIDKFFDGKGKKEAGREKHMSQQDQKSSKDRNMDNLSKEELVSEKNKNSDYIKRNPKNHVVVEALKEKNKLIDRLITAQDESESEGKLSEREQGLLDAYNKDKKAFIKQNTESAMFNPKAALENIDNWLSGSTTKEYKDMLLEAKKSLEEKIAEPKNAMSSFKEAEDKLKRFAKESPFEDEIDLDKFLEGDVVENFKEFKTYQTAVKKAEKTGNRVEWGEVLSLPLIEGREVKLPKKDIKVRVAKTTEEALAGNVSKEKWDTELRPYFAGVYNDPDGYKVATDAHSLIAVKTDVGENSGKILNPKTGDEIEGKFPNWKVIVPERFDGEKEFKLSDIHSISKQANDIRKQNPTSYMKLDGIPQYFNPEKMNNMVESLRKLGAEYVTIGYSDNTSRGISVKGKTKNGEEITGVLMPMMVEDESKVLTLK